MSSRERNSAKPITALSGVRSSCDIIARNRVFACAWSSASAAAFLARAASLLRRTIITMPYPATTIRMTRATAAIVTVSSSRVFPNTRWTTLRSAAALMIISWR